MSQEEFAKHVGISRSNISKWESNQIIPSIEMLNVIARKFGKKVDYFISSNIDEVTGEVENKKVPDNVAASGFRLDPSKISNQIQKKVDNNLSTNEKKNILVSKWVFVLITSLILMLIGFFIGIFPAVSGNLLNVSIEKTFIGVLMSIIGFILMIISIIKMEDDRRLKW